MKRENMRAVFVEYAWDMGWCDPCAADPMSNKELVELGARWIESDDDTAYGARRGAAGSNAYVTRLHVRYDATTFPEDLVFLETKDRTNFQGRYVLRHPWRGEAKCPAGERYRAGLSGQYREQAATLAQLTGWNVADIMRRMALSEQSLSPQK
jgi:hypothetical protein